MSASEPYRIFISHSSRDAVWVHHVAELVSSIGVEPYLFELDVQPGRLVAEKLELQIRRSDALVAVITENGGHSAYVQQEIGLARGANIPIVPMVERGVRSDELSFLVGVETIVVDFDNQAESLAKLATFIRRQVDRHRMAEEQRQQQAEIATQALVGLGLLLLGAAALIALNASE